MGVRKTAMAEKIKEVLADFNKFGRKGKWCMKLDIFEDLRWTLDRDPPDLTIFRDNTIENSTCTQEGVNNTIKSVIQNTNQVKSNVPAHSVNSTSMVSQQQQKIRRSQRLKAKIQSATKSIHKALKGNSHK